MYRLFRDHQAIRRKPNKPTHTHITQHHYHDLMFPTSSRPQHNSSNNNTAMPLEVKHLHDACERSMRHFNSGLTNDEQNRHRIALEEYNKAIAIVDSTLQTLRLTPQQWDWSNGQPKEWKRKMMKHRHLFSGRRDELQRNIIGETGSHTQNRSISSHDPHRRQHQQTNMMMTNIASMAPQTSSTTTHIQESEGGGMLDKVISFFGFGSGSSPSTTAAVRSMSSIDKFGGKPLIPFISNFCENPITDHDILPIYSQSTCTFRREKHAAAATTTSEATCKETTDVTAEAGETRYTTPSGHF